jgi:hypothetical protein
MVTRHKKNLRNLAYNHSSMKNALVAAIVLGVLAAQAPETPTANPEKTALVYTGQPVRLGFECTEEDMQWGGLTCTEEEPCPVYLELSAVESIGNKVFAAGNIHTSDVTLYSVVLASEDAGKTWQEPYDRMRGTSLDHIQFIDFESGWVSGQLLVPVPQDPFLLITSDSGKTWRRRPVFGEARAGTIQHFWFSSRTSGSLLIDRSQSGEATRFELYESANGGESWSVREMSDKPIRMRRAGVPNTDWRIRADAPTKSFRIERHQGERWATIASFLVPISQCKPAPRVEAPVPEVKEAPATPPAQTLPPVRPRKPPTLKKPR